MFGRVEHQIDEKNRMRIPAIFLNAFPAHEKLYFIEYAVGCVSIMPESVRDRRLGVVEDFDPSDEELMDSARRIFESIMPVEIDGQGRAKIPKMFRESAGLTKDIVTVGLKDYIEVWDRDRYEQKRAERTLQQANMAYYSKKKSEPNA